MRTPVFFLFLFLLIPTTFAIGVSPPSYVMEYEVGFEHEFTHRIINTADREIEASVTLEGDLAPYITFYNESLKLGGPSGILHYGIKLPEDIDLVGPKYAKFHVTEEITHTGSGTGARTAVIAILRIDFPYPGKYALMYMYTKDVNEGEDIQVPVSIINLGNETLNDMTLTLRIEDSQDNLLFTKTLEGISALPQKEIEITHTFPSTGLPPGPYMSYGVLDYGVDTAENQKQFAVGTYDIQILDYTKMLREESISPVTIKVKSRWDGELNNVFGILNVNGKDHKSATHQFTSFQEKTLEFFIDSTGIPMGNVKGTLTLYFDDKKKEQILDFSIESEPKVEEPVAVVEPEEESKTLSIPLNLTTLLVVIVIILIAFNIYILMRKEKKKK
jgi:hypothetical protein